MSQKRENLKNPGRPMLAQMLRHSQKRLLFLLVVAVNWRTEIKLITVRWAIKPSRPQSQNS